MNLNDFLKRMTQELVLFKHYEDYHFSYKKLQPPAYS